MHRWTVVLVAAFVLVAVGCSVGGRNPVAPASGPDVTVGSQSHGGQTQTHLWGYWDVYIDIKNQTVEAVFDRSVMFAANVVSFLNKNPLSLSFHINDTPIGPDYIDVDIDVGLEHPFPGLPEYRGYDVRGVFMGDGSVAMAHNNDLVYPVLGTDQFMLPDPDDGFGGPDGYTRWFNYTEFSGTGMPLFLYTQGKAASPGFAGTATLNPYKYFADGLGTNEDLPTWLDDHYGQRGVFSSAATNERNYYLRFPNDKGVRYGYAVIANWEGMEPEYHPANAPEAVACKVVDNSDVWFVDATQNGGSLRLDIGVFDWDSHPSAGVMEDYKIFIESTVLSSVYEFSTTDMAPIGGGENFSTYHVEIGADNITRLDGNEYWVIVEDQLHDYSNEFGVPNLADTDALAVSFRYALSVGSEPPSASITVLIPNGGEYWMAGTSYDITWESVDVTGSVKIEFSMDSGASWPVVIGDDTANDYIESWTPQAEHYTSHGRTKISSINDPAIFDISDGDFTIDGGWVKTWGSSSYDCAYDGVAADSSGNVYVGGQYSGTCYFDPNDPGNDASRHTSNGNNDCFITKLDPSGKWQWTEVWGDGGSSNDQITAIAIDPDDYVYVAYNVNGGQTTGVQKFDSSGNAVWGWTDNPKDNGPGGWSAIDTGIAADTTGVYWSYYLYSGGFTYKIRKYDTTGANLLWEVVDPQYDDNGTLRQVQVRPDNSNRLALDPSGSTLWVAGNIRHSDNGGVQCDWAWIGSFDTGTGAEGTIFVYGVDSTANTGSATATTVEIDEYNHLLVTGNIQGTGVYLAPSGDATHASLVAGMADCYMTKFDSTTGEIEPGWPAIWTSIDTDSKCPWDNPRALCLDDYGNAYVSGRLRSDNMQIGTTIIYRTDPDPMSADAFFAKISSDGTWEWAYGFGSTENLAGWEIGYALFSRGDFVYCGGYFENTVDFAPNGEPEGVRTSNGSLDVWVTKHKLDGTW